MTARSRSSSAGHADHRPGLAGSRRVSGRSACRRRARWTTARCRIGNRLLGNAEGAAGLEVTLDRAAPALRRCRAAWRSPARRSRRRSTARRCRSGRRSTCPPAACSRSARSAASACAPTCSSRGGIAGAAGDGQHARCSPPAGLGGRPLRRGRHACRSPSRCTAASAALAGRCTAADLDRRRGRCASCSARTARPTSSRAEGLAGAARRATGPCTTTPTAPGAPRRAAPRLGAAATAARPVCTRRTSSTAPTASARSCSPATWRSIVGADGPSLGGFVALAQVIGADLLAARAAARRATQVLRRSRRGRAERAHAERRSPRGRWPAMPRPGVAPAAAATAACRPSPATGAHGPLTYRRAGERALLVEFGEPGARPRARACAPTRCTGRARRRAPRRRARRHRPACARCTSSYDPDRAERRERLVDALDRLEAAAARDPRRSTIPGRTVHAAAGLAPQRGDAGRRALPGLGARGRPLVPGQHRLHPPHQRPARRGARSGRSCSTRAISCSASGDVYLGAPVAVPLDPRHRLVTTKYNPARTWTPANAVGIGGAFLCVYGIEGPGGYQLSGAPCRSGTPDRRARRGGCATSTSCASSSSPSRELEELRAAQRTPARGARRREPASFSLGRARALRWPPTPRRSQRSRRAREAAFAAERDAWAAERGTRGGGGVTLERQRAATDYRAGGAALRVAARICERSSAAAGLDLAASPTSSCWRAAARWTHADRVAAAVRASPSRSRTTSTSPACRRPPAAPASRRSRSATAPVVAAPARRRRAARRQDEHGPVRHRPRRHAQPVRCLLVARSTPRASAAARARARRVAVALGHVAVRARDRHRRLRAGAGRVQRARRRSSRRAGCSARRGVVPACASLDCVSVFSRIVADAATRARRRGRGFDPLDPWSRRARRRGLAAPRGRIGVPLPGQASPDEPAAPGGLGASARARGRRSLDARPDRRRAAARGRAAALRGVGRRAHRRPRRVHRRPPRRASTRPSRRSSRGGGTASASTCSRRCTGWPRCARAAARDCGPRSTRCCCRRRRCTRRTPQVAADPVGVNERLGRFTNFVNLMDLAAVALPGPCAPRRAAVRGHAARAGLPRLPAAGARRRRGRGEPLALAPAGERSTARGRRRPHERAAAERPADRARRAAAARGPRPLRSTGSTRCPRRRRRAARAGARARPAAPGIDGRAVGAVARGARRAARRRARAAGDRPGAARRRRARSRGFVCEGHAAARAPGHHRPRRLARVPGGRAAGARSTSCRRRPRPCTGATSTPRSSRC